MCDADNNNNLGTVCVGVDIMPPWGTAFERNVFDARVASRGSLRSIEAWAFRDVSQAFWLAVCVCISDGRGSSPDGQSIGRIPDVRH